MSSVVSREENGDSRGCGIWLNPLGRLSVHSEVFVCGLGSPWTLDSSNLGTGNSLPVLPVVYLVGLREKVSR